MFSTVNSFPLPYQRPLRKRSFGSDFCLFGSFGFVSGSAPVVALGRAVLNLSGECRYASSTVRFCGGIFSWRRTASIFAAPTVLATLLPVRLKCNNVSKAKLLKRVYLTTLILRHFRAWDKVTESGQRVTVRADRASSARLKAKRDRLFRCCCLALLLFMVLLCGA